MGLLIDEFCVEYITGDGNEYKCNLCKGKLVSWMKIAELIKNKNGFKNVVITKIVKL